MKKNITIAIIFFVIGGITTGIVYSAINFETAIDKDTFTKQDVLDTDMENVSFTASVVDNSLTETIFQLTFDLPQLTQDGNDFKVLKEQQTISYYLEDYNECRNEGLTK